MKNQENSKRFPPSSKNFSNFFKKYQNMKQTYITWKHYKMQLHCATKFEKCLKSPPKIRPFLINFHFSLKRYKEIVRKNDELMLWDLRIRGPRNQRPWRSPRGSSFTIFIALIFEKRYPPKLSSQDFSRTLSHIRQIERRKSQNLLIPSITDIFFKTIFLKEIYRSMKLCRNYFLYKFCSF